MSKRLGHNPPVAAAIFTVATFLTCGCVAETDTESGYSIVGNVGSIHGASDDARIVVRQTVHDEDGVSRRVAIGESAVRNGLVDLEGDVPQPTVVDIDLEINGKSTQSTPAVIAPGAVIRLVPRGRIQGFLADGTGRHAELVSSWTMNDIYLERWNEYEDLFQRWLATNAAWAKDVAEGAVDSTAASKAESSMRLTQDVFNRRNELADHRKEMMDEVARTQADPLNALLAMELGGLEKSREGLDRLDELAGVLDEETIALRIEPRRKYLRSYLKRVATDERLGVGRTGLDFSLVDLEGRSVALHSVLGRNEVVFLDFWASWCGPCVAAFPKLMETYAEHHGDGFEIVAVSIDSDPEDWREASIEHALPWINLGEIGKQRGPVAHAYGVTAIPKGYVLGTDGSIVAKDLDMDELRELLADRLGGDAIRAREESTSAAADGT